MKKEQFMSDNAENPNVALLEVVLDKFSDDPNESAESALGRLIAEYFTGQYPGNTPRLDKCLDIALKQHRLACDEREAYYAGGGYGVFQAPVLKDLGSVVWVDHPFIGHETAIESSWLREDQAGTHYIQSTKGEKQ